MATLSLAPLPKPSKAGNGPRVAAALLGFLAVPGPLFLLTVSVARLDPGWTPGLIAPWARGCVESVERPGAAWWILGGAAVLGGIGALVKQPSMLWLGSLIGLVVTVTFVLLARVMPATNRHTPGELAQASCSPPDTVTVAFYGTPTKFDVWANFGCPALTDGSHYWMFSRLTDVGSGNTSNTYPLTDLGDGSGNATYSSSPDDPILNRCYFVGLVPPAELERVAEKQAGHQAFLDGELPAAVQVVSPCVPPDPEPYP